MLHALIGKGYCLHLRNTKVDFINLEKIIMSTEVEKLMVEAAELAKAEQMEAAIEKYKSVLELDAKNIDAQFQIGELYHQMGNLPEALSAYLHTTDLDSEHKKANVKIEMIKSILDFFNPDLYNP